MKRLSHNTSETNIPLAPKERFLGLCKVFTKCSFNTLLFLQVPERRTAATDAEMFEFEGFVVAVVAVVVAVVVDRHIILGLLPI